MSDRETDIRQAIRDCSFAEMGDEPFDMAEVYVDKLTQRFAAREAALQARIDAALARCDHWSGSGNAVYRLAAREIRADLAGDTTEAGR